MRVHTGGDQVMSNPRTNKTRRDVINGAIGAATALLLPNISRAQTARVGIKSIFVTHDQLEARRSPTMSRHA